MLLGIASSGNWKPVNLLATGAASGIDFFFFLKGIPTCSR